MVIRLKASVLQAARRDQANPDTATQKCPAQAVLLKIFVSAANIPTR